MATISRTDSSGLIFAYTPDEKHAILTALEQAGMKEDIDREAILQRITEAARQALVRHDYALKFPRPPASQVRKELEGLIAAIKQLQVAVFSLSDHTRSFISGDLNNSDDPAEPLLNQARLLDLAERILIDYRVGRAKEIDLPSQSVEIVSVGQCWHWFDRARVPAEVARILCRDGSLVIAHLIGFRLPAMLWTPQRDRSSRTIPPRDGGGGYASTPSGCAL